LAQPQVRSNYLRAYATAAEARQTITAYLEYNNERLHQALDYRTRQVFEQALQRASSGRGINAGALPPQAQQ
jgi:transposase InsO family protein